LEQIPNIGKSIADDLRLIGIREPAQLKGQDGLALYERLNRRTGVRHDPCVADTFMAAVAFMNGGKPTPWWKFTAKRKTLLLLALTLAQFSWAYPAHWWAPVSKKGAPAWEILPQEAKPPEVILSKRHELGLLSNFAPTPFEFRGKRYASLEGFWQSLLHPENPDDPRAKFPGLIWKHTRDEVAAMTAFEAKAAGDLALQNMKKMGINWVSFEGRRFDYWTKAKGGHYNLIVEVTKEKVKQNPKVKEVLLATKGLRLRPDHHQEPDAPPSWRYFQILTEIRESLL
jgi:predicted NAD-dependent protein-ADP-ribosyltransferase YbiA (DUF1768 family)